MTHPRMMRNCYGRKDLVPSELPDSSNAICLLRREEKYYSGAVGSTAESLPGAQDPARSGGHRALPHRALHLQSGLGPGSERHRSVF